MNQLKYGIRTESEHKDVVAYIKRYLKKKKRLPSQRDIFKAIALSHLKEDKHYYLKLKKARL